MFNKKSLILGFLVGMSSFLETGAQAQAVRYAAIAYATDGSGRVGTSWNAATQWDAQQAALLRCGLPQCQILVWTTTCAAISVTYWDNRSGGYGLGRSRYLAERNSVAACNRSHGETCRVVASVCNSY